MELFRTNHKIAFKPTPEHEQVLQQCEKLLSTSRARLEQIARGVASLRRFASDSVAKIAVSEAGDNRVISAREELERNVVSGAAGVEEACLRLSQEAASAQSVAVAAASCAEAQKALDVLHKNAKSISSIEVQLHDAEDKANKLREILTAATAAIVEARIQVEARRARRRRWVSMVLIVFATPVLILYLCCRYDPGLLIRIPNLSSDTQRQLALAINLIGGTLQDDKESFIYFKAFMKQSESLMDNASNGETGIDESSQAAREIIAKWVGDGVELRKVLNAVIARRDKELFDSLRRLKQDNLATMTATSQLGCTLIDADRPEGDGSTGSEPPIHYMARTLKGLLGSKFNLADVCPWGGKSYHLLAYAELTNASAARRPQSMANWLKDQGLKLPVKSVLPKRKPSDMYQRQSKRRLEPSFNCGHRLTQVERMICDSEDLSKADRELSNLYSAILQMISSNDEKGVVARNALIKEAKRTHQSNIGKRNVITTTSKLKEWYEKAIPLYRNYICQHYRENHYSSGKRYCPGNS